MGCAFPVVAQRRRFSEEYLPVVRKRFNNTFSELESFVVGNRGKRKSRNAVLGLDLGSHTIKAVEMIRNGSVLSIRNCSLVEANAATYVDSIASVVKVGLYRADSLAIALSGRGILLQTVTLSADKADDMHVAVRDAVAEVLPYAIDEAVTDYYLDANSHGRNISALAVAARKTEIVRKIQLVHSAGLEPDRVEVELISLANAVETACAGNKDIPPGTPLCLVDFGASKTLITVTDGVNRLFHEFPFGGNKLTEILAHRMGCSQEKAESLKLAPSEHMDLIKDALYPGLEDMTSEVRACLTRFRQEGRRAVDYIFVSGGVIGFPDFTELMGRMIGKTVRAFNPFESFATGNLDAGFLQAHAHRMSVAFGLSCHAGE